MNLMPDPTGALQEDDFERQLERKLAEYRELLRSGEDFLRKLRREKASLITLDIDPQRYSGLDQYAAMMVFFRSSRGRTVTEDELAEELISGNVKTGSASQDPAIKKANVIRSLKAQTNGGTIKRVGDKYGLPEWGDEAF